MTERKGPSLVFDLAPPALAGIPWSPWRPGVEIFRLHGDEQRGSAAVLLRYAPGARVPLHEHGGHEHVLVLAGSQRDDTGTFAAGTMVIHRPGTRHRVWSEEGCTVLIVWERPVILIGDE
jgi:anti-sigma factor ChrR (cupin superfamily)